MKEKIMSKIYIDPLNLSPVLIDTKDFSQCEVDNAPPVFEVWQLPRHEEWKKNISKAHKGSKKPWAKKNLGKGTEGMKRPEHSKLMREYYEQGRIKPPVGMAKGKRTGQALENIRKGVKKRYNKVK